jgi:hypothetical protein
MQERKTMFVCCLLNLLISAQIMLWERKLMLEKEMHDAMDPNIGQDVVGEMKREIHRMQLRHAELMRLQEKLVLVSTQSCNPTTKLGVFLLVKINLPLTFLSLISTGRSKARLRVSMLYTATHRILRKH